MAKKLSWGRAGRCWSCFDHHQPRHKREVLFGFPLNIIPTMLVITGPIGYVLSGWSGTVSAFFMALIATCVYELFYGIQHLNNKLKSRFVQKLKRAHLLHHFYPEAVNMGIVGFFPDMAFRSYFKSAKDGSKSPAVFTLGDEQQDSKWYPKVMELTGAPPKDKRPTASETKMEQAG